jgi:hypothetical protein
MTRWITGVAAVLVLVGAPSVGPTPAFAQEAARPGPGTFEVTLIPGGATFFTAGKDTAEPSFGNYDLGAGATVNFNRFVGVEGEVGGSLGISQGLVFRSLSADVKTPHLLGYTGNVVLSVANRSSVVPYITGGVGGLSVFETASLGIDGTETFLTGNVGAGLKWYAGRWGLRGDYRFTAVKSKDNAPEFFGREVRYGHRVYAGVVLNVVR